MRYNQADKTEQPGKADRSPGKQRGKGEEKHPVSCHGKSESHRRLIAERCYVKLAAQGKQHADPDACGGRGSRGEEHLNLCEASAHACRVGFRCSSFGIRGGAAECFGQQACLAGDYRGQRRGGARCDTLSGGRYIFRICGFVRGFFGESGHGFDDFPFFVPDECVQNHRDFRRGGAEPRQSPGTQKARPAKADGSTGSLPARKIHPAPGIPAAQKPPPVRPLHSVSDIFPYKISASFSYASAQRAFGFKL